MFESKKEMLVFYSYFSPGVFFLRAFENSRKYHSPPLHITLDTKPAFN